VTILGLSGLLVMAAMRPLVVFLLPLAGLALFAIKLGARTVMFGSVPVALGIALPLHWFFKSVLPDRPWRRAALLGLQAVLLVVLAWPYVQRYAQMPPTPVVRNEHAQALIKLRDIAPADSTIWTWWDWGYATHYYARRNAFADGARHGGEYVFPLGLVMTTHNPRLANQFIHFSASQDNRPWEDWADKSAKQIESMLVNLANKEYHIPLPAPQYLVVTSENLPLVPWISFYGTWNFQAKNGVHAKVSKLEGELRVDNEQGVLSLGNQRVTLSTVDALTAQGRQFRDYKRPGPHLILDMPSSRAYLMDDLAYNSLMVRLLLVEPTQRPYADYFELVYDGFPAVRIYRVK
jgi:dolichyl-diphosphooligosaccharide--protein glycosyltransferase